MKNLYRVVFVSLLVGWSAIVCTGQVTFRIVSLPASTPPDAEIFISGNFEGWTGGQAAYKLEKGADSLYAITLPQMVGSIQYKFTRGSWASVEKGPNGEEIANRVYAFGGNGAMVDIAIHNWADLSGITSTAADNVYLLDDNFFIPQLNRTRKIWIYLPPGYVSSQGFYPVMYMHDGQNLFDDSTSFAGEWHVDETLNALYDETGFGLIVIGIENDGAHRIDEYSPWIDPQYGGGEGETYLAFIVETLKPFVDSAYRTYPEASNTGIMGSSMGGLISQYGGIAEPDVFGKIGVFSPSFGIFDSCYIYTEQQGVPENSKFYFLAGGLEGTVVERVQEMVDLMLAEGSPVENIQMVADPGGMHHEAFWSVWFGDAVEWLFQGTSDVEDRASDGVHLNVFPNPAANILIIEPINTFGTFTLELRDIKGMLLHHQEYQGRTQLTTDQLPKGVYVVRLQVGEEQQVTKVIIR